MRRGRIIKGVGAIAAAAALFAAGAQASGLSSSPKNVIKQGYTTTTAPNVSPTTHSQSNGPSSGVLGTPAAAVKQRTLPFTGLDLALMAVGGTGLLLLGAGLRRFARSRA